MIFSIMADAASESGNVLIVKSFPFARTVICALFAFITKPSNLSSPVVLDFGFTALTMIGAAVSATMIGTVTGVCAPAGAEKTPDAASISGSPSQPILANLFIQRRPWQSARTSETARPGGSWPAAGLVSCHYPRRMVPDRSEERRVGKECRCWEVREE